MTVALEGTTTTTDDDATSTAGNSAASGPPRSGLTARHAGTAFAKSAALVVDATVMSLIVLAIIALANEGRHANRSYRLLPGCLSSGRHGCDIGTSTGWGLSLLHACPDVRVAGVQ
jgi:hypothetical protein